jgi:hypothetical protein
MARESMKILISATCFYNIAKIAEHKCLEDRPPVINDSPKQWTDRTLGHKSISALKGPA